jgi:hypothetical protein
MLRADSVPGVFSDLAGPTEGDLLILFREDQPSFAR